ncbi:hypothetical protein K439DRAFT_1336652 [Ramaria rubella]|nr:hypothetical protein K439DRAFT_1336652 [Ramaria rubella]
MHNELSQTDLDAIASLLLGDVEDITTARKEKRREDSSPADDEVAFDVFANDLKSLLSVIQDQEFARSVAAAVETDHALIEALTEADNRLLEDRAMALYMGEGRDSEAVTRPPSVLGERSPVEEPAAEEEAQTEQNDSETEASVPRSMQSTVGLESFNEIQGIVSCAICRDGTEARDLHFPCGDVYHVACAVELFEAASKDESLMPPRCCRQPIPTNIVIPHLSRASRTLFLEKLEEHQTLDRLYCPEPSCSQFIGPASGERSDVSCPKCARLVCAACKRFAHPQDIPCTTEDDDELFDLAKAQGWQRCPGCSHMVELALGCYHMTCLCQNQFCYLCREPWKNCACAQWDEGRLIAAAEHQVENQIAQNPRLVVPDMRAHVRNVAEDLRNNHECMHPRWAKRLGGAQCESCHYYLREYILCCTTCQMRACVRCRRNRL